MPSTITRGTERTELRVGSSRPLGLTSSPTGLAHAVESLLVNVICTGLRVLFVHTDVEVSFLRLQFPTRSPHSTYCNRPHPEGPTRWPHPVDGLASAALWVRSGHTVLLSRTCLVSEARVCMSVSFTRF